MKVLARLGMKTLADDWEGMLDNTIKKFAKPAKPLSDKFRKEIETFCKNFAKKNNCRFLPNDEITPIYKCFISPFPCIGLCSPDRNLIEKANAGLQKIMEKYKMPITNSQKTTFERYDDATASLEFQNCIYTLYFGHPTKNDWANPPLDTKDFATGLYGEKKRW